MLHTSLHGGPAQTNQVPWESYGDIWSDAINPPAAASLCFEDWWVPQPQSPEDVMNFQHIQQLWNYHSEDAKHSFPDDSLTTWQGADGRLQSPAENPWTGTLVQGFPTISLADKLVTDNHDLESETPSENRSSKSTYACEGSAKPTTSFSSLPLPVRVTIDPERVVNQVQADMPRQGAEAHHGLLPTPGLILARAASLSSGKMSTAMAKDTPEAISPAISTSAATPVTPSSDTASALPSNGALSAAPASSADPHPGVSIGSAIVGGAACTRVEWSIEDFRGKLLASMGRPIVSPAFAVQGMPNLRLMIFPDARDVVKNARSRDRKSLYETMVRKGPLHGALKLKADCLEPGRDANVVRLNLLVGAVRRGPFTFDFTKRAVADCDDFGTDWLKQIDKAAGNLRVCAEILTIGKSGDGFPTVPISDALHELGTPEEREAHDQPWRVPGRRTAKSQQRLRAC